VFDRVRHVTPVVIAQSAYKRIDEIYMSAIGLFGGFVLVWALVNLRLSLRRLWGLLWGGVLSSTR